MDSWEDFDENAESGPAATTDKWEGEDEDDVADSWDALSDEEEKEGEGDGGVKVNGDVKSKPKRRSMAAIVAEKEAAKVKAEEERKKREEEMKNAPPALTPAQLQRIQEDSDLELCKDTFGVFDSQDPTSKDDFDRMGIMIRDKLIKYQDSPHFGGLLENLFRDLSISIEVDTLRKLSTMFSAMASEKQKQAQKTNVTKKKAKGKVVVKMERNDDIFGADSNNFVDDDDEDFM